MHVSNRRLRKAEEILAWCERSNARGRGTIDEQIAASTAVTLS